jgi:hypothetical protein
MRINIYSLQKETYESFLSFIDQSLPFETQWYPLNEDVVVEEIPHFSIFLLSIHNANSSWLKEHIEHLKGMGAHDRNFYFVLHNKEAAPRSSDISVVIEDLQKSFSKSLVNPTVHPISIRAYEAFIQEDNRFMYFDDTLHEHRTIKQLKTGDANDYLTFQRYIGKEHVDKILEEWSNSPFLLFWKNSDTTTLLVYDVPNVVINSLNKSYNINLITVNNEAEFLKLQQDKQIISLTSKESYETNDLLPNQFILSKSFSRSAGTKLYFDEDVYALEDLPVKEIIGNNNLVFCDAKGYPKQKSKIKDWDRELANLSGLTNVIKKIGECIQ